MRNQQNRTRSEAMPGYNQKGDEASFRKSKREIQSNKSETFKRDRA